MLYISKVFYFRFFEKMTINPYILDSVDYSSQYFVNAGRIVYIGKIAKVHYNSIMFEHGIEFDLWKGLKFGYENVQKREFKQKEIPKKSIRVLMKM